MNLKSHVIYSLSVLLLTTWSCSGQYDDTPGGDGYGHPLTFTVVQSAPEEEPHARVSENPEGTGSLWDGGEVINVCIDGGKTGTYTLAADGTATAITPCYWSSTAPATVTALYSNISGQNTGTGNTVSLSDQSKGLAYVMKAVAQNVSYNSDITLNFVHQLAKVRMKLEKGTFTEDISVLSVKVRGYTACSINGFDLTGGSDEGYVMMHGNGEYFEANLVPGLTIRDAAFEINTGDGKTITADLDEDLTPEAGKVYTLSVKTNVPGTITGGYVITEPGNYIMTGKTDKTVTIDCDGEVNLTMVDVTSTGVPAIKVVKGDPVVIFKGDNLFQLPSEMTNVILLEGKDANITLDGQGSGNLHITMPDAKRNLSNNAIIGGEKDSEAGDITIRDMTLNIDISVARWLNAAVIGSGFGYDKNTSCGYITISNTDLTINGGNCNLWGAFIGTGCQQVSGTNSCGDIIITLLPGQTQQQFLNKLTARCADDPNYTKPDPIGKGGSSKISPATTVCGTITWN